MIDGQKVHPTFLYESIWNILLFAFIFRKRKNKKYDGELIADYLIYYSIGRFFIEGLRTDSLMIGPLRTAQLISLISIVIGIIIKYYLKKKVK